MFSWHWMFASAPHPWSRRVGPSWHLWQVLLGEEIENWRYRRKNPTFLPAAWLLKKGQTVRRREYSQWRRNSIVWRRTGAPLVVTPQTLQRSWSASFKHHYVQLRWKWRERYDEDTWRYQTKLDKTILLALALLTVTRMTGLKTHIKQNRAGVWPTHIWQRSQEYSVGEGNSFQ